MWYFPASKLRWYRRARKGRQASLKHGRPLRFCFWERAETGAGAAGNKRQWQPSRRRLLKRSARGNVVMHGVICSITRTPQTSRAAHSLERVRHSKKRKCNCPSDSKLAQIFSPFRLTSTTRRRPPSPYPSRPLLEMAQPWAASGEEEKHKNVNVSYYIVCNGRVNFSSRMGTAPFRRKVPERWFESNTVRNTVV